MKRQLKIFLAGLFALVPFAITVWVIWWVGLALEKLGVNLALGPIWKVFELEDRWPLEQIHGVGAVILIVAIYLVGLLMHFWLFRGIVRVFERIFEKFPGVKTIYESVRDLMKLFGSESRQKMGRVVEYLPPGAALGVLGILTNEQPSGTGDADRAAVYFPLAYMIGGPVMFVPRDHLREVDMPVERALRLCATAQVGIDAPVPGAGEGAPTPSHTPSKPTQDSPHQTDQDSESK